MREPDIISLCKNIYDKLDIQNAKNLAFLLYNIEDKKINRKAANKLASDLQDTTKIVRTKIQDENIKFCITFCKKLLLISLDYIDAGFLIKEISNLRTEINKYSLLSQQLNELKTEVNEFKLNNDQVRSKDINLFDLGEGDLDLQSILKIQR